MLNIRRTPRSLALATSLVASLGVSALLAQEPKPAPNAPVEKELKAFQESVAKKFPADRLKAYDEGVEEVRKSGMIAKALKVGDKAPDFELPNASGRPVKLSTLLKGGPVILTWYRGGWCPYCNIGLRGFQQVLPEIKSEGATLVAISPELPDNSLKTAEKDGLEFEVLSDKGNKVAQSFGVAYKLPKVVSDQFKGRLDLAKHNGDDSDTLPLGATYLVDRDGTIRYAFVDHDYRRRAEPATVVSALHELKKTP